MKCPVCGIELDQDAVFCHGCGAALYAQGQQPEAEYQQEYAENTYEGQVWEEQNDYQPQEPLQPQRKELPRFVTVALGLLKAMNKAKLASLIVGTLLIIIGLSRVASAGTSISSTSFGGDFYTYTYRGIVAISEILADIEVSLGWVITAIGAAIDVSALRK